MTAEMGVRVPAGVTTHLKVSGTLISRVLPEVLSPERSAGERRRLRKLGSLLLVLLGATGPMVLWYLITAHPKSALGTGVVTLTCLVSLYALRRGASVAIITPVVLGVGLLAAAVMAMSNGRDGMPSVLWMMIAPLLALAAGGRRAGWVTLGLSLVLVTLTLYGMDHGWLAGISEDRGLGPRVASLMGACITAFLLTRAYESETEISIAELEAHNHALLEARAAADQANRAKSDFLATISHEIRTPLNGVTGMATLLDGERDPARVKEGLRVIQQSADSLLTVISDVLDFSKIESNRLDLEVVPMSPATELRLVVDLLQSRAAENADELELHVAPDVPAWIKGDPTRLRQVAMNLVSNAVKFTSKGKVGVSLSRRDGRLVLEVRDTGIGMNAQSLERIFQPFAQADASTTRRFGGTGLGLVISQRLVVAMGGTISVRSEPGQGSCFTVTLPCEPVEGPLRVPPAVRSLAKKSVLLVEDNFVNQVVATRLLEKLGHEVTVASDGAQALARCEGRAFDLELMDCHMPVMDGFDATLELRKRGVTTPIFALTAAVTTEDQDRCLASGMSGVLSKPLRLERLVEILGEHAAGAPVELIKRPA